MLFEGVLPEVWDSNPFMRHHENIFKYSSHLYDIDDHAKIHFDTFERFKKFTPKKKNVIGVTKIIPQQDNDEAWDFYDIQGESLYSNPPSQQTPAIDQGGDEEHIWAFPRTIYNQTLVKNEYFDGGSKEVMKSFAPHWGQKMTQPHFFKEAKMEKFFRHWEHRKGLEALKVKHAALYG